MEKESFLFLRKRVIFFTVLSILCVPLAYGQPQLDNLEKATRPAENPEKKAIPEEQPGKPPEKPAPSRPSKAPAAKETQKFFIKKIQLIGCKSISAEVFSPFLKAYEQKELTFSDLEALAKQIEQEYLRQGIIAAVFVPEQELTGATVTLQVVEAKMGQLEVQNHAYFRKERLRYYWQIPGDEVIRFPALSQSVQMMNKNPDREVRAALHAGKEPGTTDVLLTPKTRFPLHFFSTGDNEGSISTGKYRTGLGLRHNNFLGLDDMFIVGDTFGKEFNGAYAYHLLPISPHGASLVYGYSHSVATPKKEYTVYGIRSKADVASVSVHQDLYKKGDYVGETYVGFDAKDKTVTMHTDTGTYTRDRLRIIKLGTKLTDSGLGSSSNVYSEFSQGLPAFGASANGNPLASSGAKSTFSKITFGGQYKKILPLNLQANVRVDTQLASTKLPPQETFGLGGIDSVRGYPESDYLADNALFTSGELLIPSFFIPQNLHVPYDSAPLRDITNMVVFLDYGHGARRGALSSEQKSVDDIGVGAGLRIKLFNQVLLRLEWGFPVGGDKPITGSGLSRFHFVFDFQEKLPEELERIRKLLEEEHIKNWTWLLINTEFERPDGPMKKKLNRYFYLAQTYCTGGDLEKAKEMYEKIVQAGTDVYNQTEEYVRSCIAQEKQFQEANKQALMLYNEGKLNEAKNLWQKIIEQAVPGPLILKF